MYKIYSKNTPNTKFQFAYRKHLKKNRQIESKCWRRLTSETNQFE